MKKGDIKMGSAWAYNKSISYFETKHFEEVYKTDKAQEVKPEDLTATEVVEFENKIATSMPPASSDVVITYEQALTMVKPYLIGHIPQILGTCVAHSIKNSIRFAVKIAFGRDMDLAEGDIYIDRSTKRESLDAGMYTDRVIPRVAEKGIAIQDIVPTAKNRAELLRINRETYPDNNVQPFRVKLLKGHTIIPCYRNFDALWAMITNEYKTKGLRPFQATITSFSGWWGSDLPTATGKILGSHSCIGVALPFMWDNKRAFFVIDSAYYTGKVWRVGKGIRIVTEDCWNGLGTSARTLEFVPQIEAKLLSKTIPVPKMTDKLSLPAKKGDTGEPVIKIQKSLIFLGYDIPAISSGSSKHGYYGQQTADAVKKWQVDNWQLFNKINPYWTIKTLSALDGKSFGNLSVKVINTQI